MSLTPEFGIGLWNAWLGVVPILLPIWILMIVNREFARRIADTSGYTAKDKTMAGLSMLAYYAVILYSIVVPLKLGTMWFYIGLGVYLLVLIPVFVTYFPFTATPVNEPAVKGVYRISRNPMYFFTALALLGISIASASWLMLLLVILYCIPQHFVVLAEERVCLEKYGDPYREYMNRTPRYIGRSKIW